jgi:hypothetical protein
MEKKVIKFDEYLDKTSKYDIISRSIVYRDLNEEDGNPQSIENNHGYDTRWALKYRAKTIWKIYNFEGYYQTYPKRLPKYSLMMTLTGSHNSGVGKDGRQKMRLDSLNHIQWNKKLWEALPKFKDMVKAYFPKNLYVSIWEGHPSSGFSHVHNMFYLDELPSQEIIDTLKNHWSNTLKMGSVDRGLVVEFNEPKNFADIKSFVGYPMSYVGKNTSNSKGGYDHWDEFDWVYNTAIWWCSKPKEFGGIGHDIRTIQPSFGLSKIWKRSYIPDIPWIDYKALKPVWIDTRMKVSTSVCDAVDLKTCENHDAMLEYWEDNYVVIDSTGMAVHY